MQVSFVLSQRVPGAGDLDECGMFSGLACGLAVAPWLYLPSVESFRKAAGDPDDGKADGWSSDEIIRGVAGVWPAFAGKLRKLDRAPFAEVRELVEAGRPLSVALILGRLPAELRYTASDVPHQSSLVFHGGRLLFSNPMAPAQSRWDVVTWPKVRPAIEAHAGAGRVNGVLFPTAADMIATHPLVRPAITRARADERAMVAGAAETFARRAADSIAALRPKG